MWNELRTRLDSYKRRHFSIHGKWINPVARVYNLTGAVIAEGPLFRVYEDELVILQPMANMMGHLNSPETEEIFVRLDQVSHVLFNTVKQVQPDKSLRYRMIDGKKVRGGYPSC